MLMSNRCFSKYSIILVVLRGACSAKVLLLMEGALIFSNRQYVQPLHELPQANWHDAFSHPSSQCCQANICQLSDLVRFQKLEEATTTVSGCPVGASSTALIWLLVSSTCKSVQAAELSHTGLQVGSKQAVKSASR